MKFVRDCSSIYNLENLRNGNYWHHGEMCLDFVCGEKEESIYLHFTIFEEEYPLAKDAIEFSFERFLYFVGDKEAKVFNFSWEEVQARYERHLKYLEKLNQHEKQ